MNLDSFWAAVDAQLAELRTAQTGDDVLRILARERDPYGPDHNTGAEGFFAGGGGDATVWGALSEAGWSTVWIEADYYWCMRAPNGDLISYVEGDIYRGDSQERKS